MAIIKCPECGHEISDKAPFCPSCGVAISGKVTICASCGKPYFTEQKECPYCHAMKKDAFSKKDIVAHQPNQNTNLEVKTSYPNHSTKDSEQFDFQQCSSKRNNVVIIIVSIFIALVISCVCWFFYHQGNVERENQAYELALNSSDPQVVQQYLDKYLDNAPEEHVTAMQEHLASLQQADADWTNAVVSGSKSALEQYLAQHPDSPFKTLALQKIDSIDWQTAVALNTVESMETYIQQHSDGEHVEEANQKVVDINSRTIQQEDKLLVSSVFDGFFNGLNNRDEEILISSVNPLLSSFLGKNNATRNDVVTYMRKIYKADVISMVWKTLGDYSITKNDIGAGKYDYVVSLSATQCVEYSDGTVNNTKYRINAKINSEGRISELNMVKILKE